FDPQSGVVTVGDDRARAIAAVGEHFAALFEGRSPEALELREQYAFPLAAVLTTEEAVALNAFFFWTAWAASTERPGDSITYTSHWPHEPLVGNTPTGAISTWGASGRSTYSSVCCSGSPSSCAASGRRSRAARTAR